jgi:hypothetical protein
MIFSQPVSLHCSVDLISERLRILRDEFAIVAQQVVEAPIYELVMGFWTDTDANLLLRAACSY